MNTFRGALIQIITNLHDMASQELVQRLEETLSNAVQDERTQRKTYQLENDVNEIIQNLFINDKYPYLEKCRTILETCETKTKREVESQEYLLNTIKEFCAFPNQVVNKSDYEIQFLKAVVLYENYFISGAIILLEKLLQENTNKKDEIAIRRELHNIYSEDYDDDSERKRHENLKTLLALGESDSTYISDYIWGIMRDENTEEKDYRVLANTLKRKTAVKRWRYLAEEYGRDDKFYKLFEVINPPIRSLDAITIEVIVDHYLSREQVSKASKLLSRAYRANIWTTDLYYYNGMVEMTKENLKIAKDYFDKGYKEDTNNALANLGKAKYLFQINRYKASYKYFLKAFELGEEFRSIYYLISCEIKLKKQKEAEDRMLEWCNKSDVHLWMLYSWMMYQEFPKNFFEKVLQRIVIKGLGQYPSKPEVALHFICNITESEKENRGSIRYKLTYLFAYIIAIKQALTISENEIQRVYHYSKIESIKGLTTVNDEKRYLRLYNSSYMNDPAEGNAIWDYLCKQNDDLTELIEKLQKDETLRVNKRYISSFSKKRDYLPMWVQYSENAEGICYSINTNLFDKYDYSEVKNIFNPKEAEAYYKLYGGEDHQEQYVLRNVCYCKNGIPTNNEDVKLYLSEIKKLLIELKEAILSNTNICKYVIDCLDEVRYLFKDEAYSNEEEARVIVKGSEEEKICFQDSEECVVPKLYIEMERELTFDEVILGSRMQKVSEIVAYLNVCKNINSVSKSTIQYN